jgi:adenosylcobinamide kinase/adenosylcobinamide-phosphate guanylyltransferase
MMIVVIGPNSSGKSALAEPLAVQLHATAPAGGRLIYLATLVPGDEDGEQRVTRHRRQRAGLGFVTVESPLADPADIAQLDLPDSVGLGSGKDGLSGTSCCHSGQPTAPTASDQAPANLSGVIRSVSTPGDTILLEDVSNLLANLMFTTQVAEPVQATLDRITHLRSTSAHVIAVTIGGLTAQPDYSAETLDYMAALGRVNTALVEAADRVIEPSQSKVIP